MANAIVSTVNPNARATPAKPIPRFGNAAARTALPHPPKTSQNVPINSAVALLLSDIEHSFQGPPREPCERRPGRPDGQQGRICRDDTPLLSTRSRFYVSHRPAHCRARPHPRRRQTYLSTAVSKLGSVLISCCLA